jgi:hypothetical protein
MQTRQTLLVVTAAALTLTASSALLGSEPAAASPPDSADNDTGSDGDTGCVDPATGDPCEAPPTHSITHLTEVSLQEVRDAPLRCWVAGKEGATSQIILWALDPWTGGWAEANRWTLPAARADAEPAALVGWSDALLLQRCTDRATHSCDMARIRPRVGTLEHMGPAPDGRLLRYGDGLATSLGPIGLWTTNVFLYDSPRDASLDLPSESWFSQIGSASGSGDTVLPLAAHSTDTIMLTTSANRAGTPLVLEDFDTWILNMQVLGDIVLVSGSSGAWSHLGHRLGIFDRSTGANLGNVFFDRNQAEPRWHQRAWWCEGVRPGTGAATQ